MDHLFESNEKLFSFLVSNTELNSMYTATQQGQNLNKLRNAFYFHRCFNNNNFTRLAQLGLFISSVRSSSGYHGLIRTYPAATFSDFSNSSDSKVKVKVKGPNMCHIFEKHGIQGYRI